MPLVTHEPLAKSGPGSHSIKITLNDPDNLNAMGEVMADEFRTFAASLNREALPRCIVLTGAGRAFSAGGNLAMLENKTKISPNENRSLMQNFYDSFLALLPLNIPLIAAINGHAVGAGMCLAASCDIRICAEEAKLGFTFTRLGLHPGMGASYFLPRILGDARAAEMLLTARMIDAAEAFRIGLVSKVTSAATLIESACAIAGEIESCGPESVRLLVETLRRPAAPLAACLEREAACQGSSYASAQFAEGVRAAIEKRKPAW